MSNVAQTYSGPVSRVLNLPFVITASPVDCSSQHFAKRYVITYNQLATGPFAVYTESLRWNGYLFIWEHASFGDGTYRPSYRAAFDNLEFRFRGTQK